MIITIDIVIQNPYSIDFFVVQYMKGNIISLFDNPAYTKYTKPLHFKILC